MCAVNYTTVKLLKIKMFLKEDKFSIFSLKLPSP